MILRQAGLLIASLALVAASVSGCSQMPSGMFGGATLAVEPGDPCGAERAAFADSQSFFTREIAVRALTGAVVGAGGGAAIGALANGSSGALTGMLAGALTGAALGAMSGYFDQLQQQHLDQAQLAQAVNADLQRESAQMDHTAATFAALRSCRFAQADAIKAQARRGYIPRAQAQGALAQERGWFDQEVQVAQQAGVNMQNRDQQFAYAADNLHTAPPPAAPSRGRARPAPTSTAAAATVAATETIPQKRNSFETSVKTAQAQSASAFSLDTSTSMLPRLLDDA